MDRQTAGQTEFVNFNIDSFVGNLTNQVFGMRFSHARNDITARNDINVRNDINDRNDITARNDKCSE